MPHDLLLHTHSYLTPSALPMRQASNSQLDIALHGYPTLAHYGWTRRTGPILSEQSRTAPNSEGVGGQLRRKSAWLMRPDKVRNDGWQRSIGNLLDSQGAENMGGPGESSIDTSEAPNGDLHLLEEGVHEQLHNQGGKTAAIMIWLGILIDGVPESFVLGILSNAGNTPSLVTFVVGVFLANFPEAMSSASIMRTFGMRAHIIMAMWGAIFIGTGQMDQSRALRVEA